MDRTPSSGFHYYDCSPNPSDRSDDSQRTESASLVIPNPSDSSDDSEKTESASLVIPNVGYHDQEEVDSGWVVSPTGGEDGTSDSERTASLGGIQSDGHGAVIEVDSVHFRDGDQDTSCNNPEFLQKNKKHTQLKADHGKSVHPGYRQQGKGGLLKMLPENKVVRVRDIGPSSSMWKNTEMNDKTGRGKILVTQTKMAVPLALMQNRKKYLHLPQWLKDYKSHVVADINGWQHWQVRRAYSYECERKDKYYRHRDYDHTFRSKNEVKYFLDTGKVKGKGLLEKKSSDHPSGESSAPRCSTKRRMVVPANDSHRKQQGYGRSTSGETAPSSSKLPHGFA